MKSLKGTKRLMRLALRRDRITIPLVLGLVVIMIIGSAPALVSTYPTYEEQLVYVSTSAPSAVGRMFQGTVQDVSVGTILMAETYMFTAVIIAIASIMMVTRHTRHNEEQGSAELIGSSVVGKHAMLTAALANVGLFNLATAAVLTVGLGAFSEFGFEGALFFSVSLAFVGMVFAAIAAVTAQLSDYRRGANGMAIAALIAFFMVRGFGDALGDIAADGLSVTASWLTWLSPLGWGYQVFPFTANRAWPLLLLAGAFFLTAGTAYLLASRRDIGASIFPSKPGPARADKSLLSAFGLAARLQKGALIGWSVALAASGILVGVMVDDFRSFFEDSEVFNDFIAALTTSENFSKTLFAAMYTLTITIAAGYLVAAVSKMAEEENSGRLEYLMGTALSRARWMMSHIGFAAFGSILILLTFGFFSGLSYEIASGVPDIGIWELIYSALLSFPAMMVFLGVITLIFALKGRFVRVAAWGYFAYCELIGSFANIFSWPQWTVNFSPFVHSPLAPADSIDYYPFIILSLVAALLLTTSIILLRRRDLALK